MERAPTQCILCGSEEWLPLFAQKEWRVVRCAACGLGVLDPRPTPAELAELYGQEYFETNLMESGAPGSPQFEKRLGLEAHRIRLFRWAKKRGRVLDVGCGYGYFLAACQAKGYDVHGIELSGFAASHASQTLGLPVTMGALDEVDLPPASFDVVTMWHVLEHTQDPLAALARAREWLRPDGLLVVEVPNHQSTDARAFWPDWVGWGLPYHLFHFTPSTLARVLEKGGFAVARTKDYHSEAVKKRLERTVVLKPIARLVARCYSGHGIAMAAWRR